MALFKYFEHEPLQKFSHDNFIGWNPQKVSPANIFPFTGSHCNLYGVVTIIN